MAMHPDERLAWGAVACTRRQPVVKGLGAKHVHTERFAVEVIGEAQVTLGSEFSL